MFNFFKREKSSITTLYSSYLDSWIKLRDTGNIKYLRLMYKRIFQEQKIIKELKSKNIILSCKNVCDKNKNCDLDDLPINDFSLKNSKKGSYNKKEKEYKFINYVKDKISDTKNKNNYDLSENEYLMITEHIDPDNTARCLNHFITNDLLSVIIEIDDNYIYDFTENILMITPIYERRKLIKSLDSLFMKRCPGTLMITFAFFECLVDDYFLFYNLNSMAFVIDWYVLLLFKSKYSKVIEKIFSYFLSLNDKKSIVEDNHENSSDSASNNAKNTHLTKKYNLKKDKNQNNSDDFIYINNDENPENVSENDEKSHDFYKEDISNKIREHLLLTNSFQILMDKVLISENLSDYEFLNLLIGNTNPILTLKTDNLEFLYKCIALTSYSILSIIVEHIIQLFIINIKNVTFSDFILFDSFFVDYPEIFLGFLKKEEKWISDGIIRKVKKYKFAEIEKDADLLNFKSEIKIFKNKIQNKIMTSKISSTVQNELDLLYSKYDLVDLLLKMQIKDSKVFIIISLFQRNSFLSNFDKISEIVGDKEIKKLLICLVL
ncbi:hypothetical protein DMUE_0476 [Dictyocoela muelleri]|nr:hypothetical protein DMUE_0476 [Dictyocoela muelleri]